MSTPEDIREDGRRDDAEDKRREFLEQRSRMGGPEAPEPCDMCGGEGRVKRRVSKDMAIDAGFPDTEGWEYEDTCPGRCLGTGVQP